MRRSLELFNLLPAKSYVWTYTLLCGRIRELIVAKALDARGQGRELAATLKLQSWQVKNHLTWHVAFRWQSSLPRSRARSMWSSH